MKKLAITSMKTSDIELALKSHRHDAKLSMRLLCMLYLSKGKSSREVQNVLLVSHNQILIWAKRFNAQGLSGLEDKPKSGRSCKLSDEQLAWLKHLVLSESPTKFGYNTEIWTAPLLVECIEKECKVKYSCDAIYRILKNKLHLRHKKSKGFYAEANQNNREVFVETLKKSS